MLHSSADSYPGENVKRRGKLWLAAIFLASTAIIALWMTRRDLPSPPAPVIIMSPPYVFSVPQISYLDRVMPVGPGWTWLWKIRYALLGKSPTIKLDTSIIDLAALDDSVAGILPNAPEFTGAGGLRVWRVREKELRGLQELFKERPNQIVASSRIVTGDKGECSIHSGNTVLINGTQQPVGLNVRVLPLMRKATIDLAAVFSFSEAITNTTIGADKAGLIVIQTNFDLGGRFQLPKEMDGLFILPAPPGFANQKRLGLLMTADLPLSKK